MKAQFFLYVKYVGVLLFSMFLLFSCSKEDSLGKKDNPEEPAVGPLQLIITASATDIDEGEEVVFTTQTDGENIDADIFVNSTKISEKKYLFGETGVYKVKAKKDGYTDSEEIEVKVYKIDVHVAGYGQGGKVMYWKNGEVSYWTSGAKEAYVKGMDVEGEDVYIVGHEVDGDDNVPMYWKNGTAHILSGRSPHSDATSIAVDNGDVYVSGYTHKDLDFYGRYWKNGEVKSLSDFQPKDIAVSKEKVYLTGYGSHPDSPNSVVKYWHDNQFYTMKTDVFVGSGTSIFVQEDDVYIAGTETHYVDGRNRNFAKYWKNGEEVVFPYEKDQFVVHMSIFVDGQDVHVAGRINSSKGYGRVHYWKNGEESVLTDDRIQSNAYKVFVYNGDAYIAGSEDRKACYWKNGVKIELEDAIDYTYAQSIYVSRSLKE